jgi:ubiquinone/menaquinone biosynthesis C-methylase UbiE
MLDRYFRRLYARTMSKAYSRAKQDISAALINSGPVLDCGAGAGEMYQFLTGAASSPDLEYYGIEWSPHRVESAQSAGLNVMQGDLNRALPFDDGKFRCVYALSVLEHLLYGCRFMRESYRILQSGGTFVVLTPNISTLFTAALVLAGKMPSSGPHPDSNVLLLKEEVFRVRGDSVAPDTEIDNPEHRHLVVFSYRVLKQYLKLIGFEEVKGYGFGLYPFPNFMQPLLERIDPIHCHQMVFVARK